MQCDAAKKGKLLDSAFWNVMNDIFTLILPVDRMTKSPVQNFQQRYVNLEPLQLDTGIKT